MQPGFDSQRGQRFNLCPGNGCVLYVLYCVASGGGPGILLTRDSRRHSLVFSSGVLVHSFWLSLQASEQQSFEFKSYIGNGFNLIQFMGGRGGTAPIH